MRTPWPFALRRNKTKKVVASTKPPASDAPPPLKIPDATVPAPPAPPSPQPLLVDGGGDKAVKKALARLPGRPNRVLHLVRALLAAGGPLSASLADKVAEALAAEPPLLRAFVRIIISDDDAPAQDDTSSPPSPRERLRLPWAAASFIAAGPPLLRAKVTRDVVLLRELASVFVAPSFDASRAAIAGQVLQVALADAPRAAASALTQNAAFVSACVSNIEQHPAAEMLPRLVGTRVFSFNDPGGLVPAHKLSVAALAQQDVQGQLANRFAQAARKRPADCAAVAEAMAEISSRAMELPRMFEDPDERGDGYAFGITHLHIVTAHVYNDSVAALFLGKSPGPLVDVLDVAVEHAARSCEVVVPAFEALSGVLGALVKARASVLPLVRAAAREADCDELERALLSRMPRLLPMLSAAGPGLPVGRLGMRRLAVVDALLALLSAGSSETVSALLEKHRLLDAVLALMRVFPDSSVLHTRTSKALRALLERDEYGPLAVRTSGLLAFFNEHAAHDCMLAHHSGVLARLHELVGPAGGDGSPDTSQDAEDFRGAFGELVCEAQRSRDQGLCREHAECRPTLEQRLDLKNVARYLTATEDHGKLMYIKSGIEEHRKGRLDFSELFHRSF